MEEDDVMAEANRIAQKIKSEIGPNLNGKKKSDYEEEAEDLEEPEWPAPPSSVVSSNVLLPPPITPMGAASALKAFEEKKRSMQMNASVPTANAARRARFLSTFSSSDSSSSSSSSSDSSSDISSSEDSSSDSSSSESSSSSSSSSSPSVDSSSSPSSSDPPVPVSTSSSGWVPPGQGLGRTQRNNRSRRQKKRAEEEEKQEKLFQEAKERAQKREKGEKVDEEAVQQGWLLDTKGKSKPNGLVSTTQKFVVVARDGELVLPPGGGSLGFDSKKKEIDKVNANKSLKKTQHKTISADEMANQLREYRQQEETPSHSTAATPSKGNRLTKESPGRGETTPSKTWGRQPPPPSMREEEIPRGIKVTSVDCDDYYNELGRQGDGVEVNDEGMEEDEVSEAYAAFQARGKAALKAAREKEEEEQEEELRREEERRKQAEAREESALSKATWTDGRDNMVDPSNIGEVLPVDGPQEWADESEEGWADKSHSHSTDNFDLGSEKTRRSLFPDIPLVFGKKEGWNGNDVLIPARKGSTQTKPVNKTTDVTDNMELDYGSPEIELPSPSGLHRDLQRLRDIRDQEQAKAAKAGKLVNKAQDALQQARLAALATRKKNAAAIDNNQNATITMNGNH